MKKTLLNFFLLGFIGLNSDSFAQPTLTASGCNPVIGNTYTAISNGGFPQGAAGASSNIWNFGQCIGPYRKLRLLSIVAVKLNSKFFSIY
jgi:hypothetical protein